MTLDTVNWDPERKGSFKTEYVKLSEPYENFIRNLSSSEGRSLFWWATLLSSRDTWMTSVLYDSAILSFVMEEIEKDNRINVIVVEHRGVAKTLQRYCSQKKRKVKIIVSERIKRRKAPVFARFLVNYFRFIRSVQRRKKYINKNKVNHIKEDNRYLLIQTDVFPQDFSDRKFTSRDFRNLSEYAKEEILFLPYLQASQTEEEELIRFCGDCKNAKFLFREKYIDTDDYKSLIRYYRYCRHLSRKKFFLNGMDISQIVREDLVLSSYSLNSFWCLTNESLFRKLQGQGFQIRKLIDGYEAQPSSRGTFIGIHRYYPKVKTIGYVCLPLDGMNPGFFPTKEETDFDAVPQKIAVIGEIFRQLYQDRCPQTETILAPGFRLQSVFLKGKKAELKKLVNKTVLVPLPYPVSDAVFLLRLLDECSEYLRRKRITVVLKNHPVRRLYDFQDYGIERPTYNYKKTEEPISELMDESDVVMTSTGSSGFESVLNGLPVIMTSADALCYTYMPREWENKYYHVVDDANSLLKALEHYLEGSFRPISYQPQYLVQTTQETVLKLLE